VGFWGLLIFDIAYLVTLVLLAEEFTAVQQSNLFWRFVPFHVLGTAVGVAALAITLRDVYLRRFPKWTKRLWLNVILFGPLFSGWVTYMFRHGFKPRPMCNPQLPRG
jgi:uncharacterized membrane protein